MMENLRRFRAMYKEVIHNPKIIKNCAFCKEELRKVKIKLYGNFTDAKANWEDKQMFLCGKCIKKIKITYGYEDERNLKND